MSLAQLSPTSVIANPAQVNPQVKTDQAATIPQANQDAQNSIQAKKSDSVTFSQQAVNKVANNMYSAVQDIKDGANESVSEAARNKA